MNFSKLRLFNYNLTSSKGLVPILFSTFGSGVAFGGIIPLISLWLESKELSFTKIGIIIAASSLGAIFAALFASPIIRKIGYLRGAIWGIALSAISGVLFRYSDNEIGWIALRVASGMGFGLAWVVTEAWIGHIASDKGRTKAISLYAIAMALGFSIGPLIIFFTGFSGYTPFYIIAFIELIATIPLFLLINFQPKVGLKKSGSPLFILATAPTIAVGCILVGFVDVTLISHLPVLVSRKENAISELAFLIPVAIGIGNVVFQFPVALAADRFGKRKIAFLVVLTGVGSCSLIPFFLNNLFIAISLTFLGCGMIYCLYTVSLSMLSERFKGELLIVANASFIILFTLASLLGPIIAGKMMDYSLIYGLTTFLILSGFVYLLVLLVRGHKQKN